tara:strand:- start:698 stop:1006 length:309 start_codon:yes stop_codon:yes gene_type:complete
MKIHSTGISMSELAYSLGLDKSTLTRNINVLIKRDLVEKYRDSDDFRVYKVILSEKGEEYKSKLYSDLDNFTSIFLNSLDDKAKNQINLIDKLVQKLDAQEV